MAGAVTALADEECPVCQYGDCRECGRHLMWGGLHWQHHSDEHHRRWRQHLLGVIARQLDEEVLRRAIKLIAELRRLRKMRE